MAYADGGRVRQTLDDESSRNRYKFLSFSQQLERVQNAALRRVGPVLQETPDDDASTFFYEGLCKWRELDLTLHFESFSDDVHGLGNSLPLLVHHQNRIVDAVVSSLPPPRLVLC